jgi:hypothetical protein
MIRRIFFFCASILTAALLSSCSGVTGGRCTVNCGGGNNATVSVVLTATPPTPTSSLSVQAFTSTITGITLTDSSGTAVPLSVNSSSYVAEFNRVTSDSTILAAKLSVPAASYTQLQVFFSAPRVTFCTQTNPGVPGCAAGTVASVTGAAGSATISTNLSFTASQQTGIVLNANLGNSLTLNGQTIIAVNLGAASVFTAATLPPASSASDLGSGQLSHVDDVLGVVTSASGSTLTIHTTTRGNITATANSSTQYDCAANTFSGCVQLNGVAIVDTILNTDGTFTLTFYEPVDSAAADIIEGVVTGVPNSVTNQFPIVVTDTVFASSNGILSGRVNLGDQVVVTLTPGQNFSIFAKGLGLPIQSFTSSNSVSSILPGQTVAIPVSTFTAQSGVTPGAAGTTQITLRFTRVTGTMTSATLPIFSGSTLPPFFGLANSQQFGTTTGRLSLDGASSVTSISNGSTFSTSALYIGSPSAPAFVSQTVRAH